MPAIYPDGTPDVIAHIRDQAAALVCRVNPGGDRSSLRYALMVAAVTDAMVRKICLDLRDQGREDLARKVRTAWEGGQ
jgi:hypothetical protein